MKRTISIILVFVLCLSLLPIFMVQATEEDALQIHEEDFVGTKCDDYIDELDEDFCEEQDGILFTPMMLENGVILFSDDEDILHEEQFAQFSSATLSTTVAETLSAGSLHTLKIRTDGTLWAWGRNSFGQLGDGTTTDRHSPVQVQSGTTWLSVSAGSVHTLGIKTDGTLWAWGSNANGRLGDGTTTDRHTPAQVQPGTTWLSVSAGDSHTLGIKSDGTLWAWGSGTYGKLGIGFAI